MTPKPPNLPAPKSASRTKVQNPVAVVNCFAYSPAGRRTPIRLEAISDAIADPNTGFVWVGVNDPDDALLDTLQEEFGLHDLAIEDARNAHQRPKLEAYGKTLFIALHTVQMVDGRISFGETQVFLGENFLLTVRHGGSLSYASVRERFEREPELLGHGPAFALYGVLDFIVDNCQPTVEACRAELDALEQDVFSETYSRQTIARLYELKRDLTRMRMAIAPMQDILAQLSRSAQVHVSDEAKLYFRDVHDHAVRLNDSIDILRDMLTAAMNMNLSLVTIAQGEVVKKLAGWAALLAAPTLITSWYGMNFRHMPELEGRYSYAVVIGVVIVTCVGLYRYLKKVRWL